MEYARLGTSGIKVSRLAFGAGSFGVGETLPGLRKNIGPEEAQSMVGIALDAGVNFFDVSNKYVDGQSEEVLGEALRGRRSRVILATKCGLPVGPGPNDRGLSFRHLVASCDASLARLGTDWIDVYYAHVSDRDTSLEETARAFEFLVASGRVRYVAVSNWPSWMVARLHGIQAAHGQLPAVANQVYYSLVGRSVERELLEYARYSGLGIVVYSPLAGGFLSGKYRRDEPAPAGTRRSTFTLAPRIDMDQGYAALERLASIAPRYEATIGQIALAWLLRKPEVSSVTFGVSRRAQLQENLGAADLTLSDADLRDLDALTAPGD